MLYRIAGVVAGQDAQVFIVLRGDASEADGAGDRVLPFGQAGAGGE